jgi:hypothetical protein
MKFRLLTSLVAVFFATLETSFAQGTFQNLDFELANVQDLPPGQGESVAVTNGVPGWGIFPELPGGMMLHNSLPLGGAAVSVNGPQLPADQILQGVYTVALYHSVAGPPMTAGIFQTGQLPGATKSIQFYGTGTLALSFAGQDIPLFPIGKSANYTIYGGDISPFAGQTGQLLFTGNAFLDNIQFSDAAIPEPGLTALAGLGVVLLSLRLMRGPRSRPNGLVKALVLLFAASSAPAQSTFQNVDFESADLTEYLPGNTVPAANAFPGWTVNATYILYDGSSLSGEAIGIYDTNDPSKISIQGTYYAGFGPGNSSFGGTNTISLGQTGTIPLGTHSITFWGEIAGLQITFAGQPLAFSQIGSTANYNIYGADISAFAGQTGQLLFSAPPFTHPANLDNIQFSPSQVPEPETFALSALGALLLLAPVLRRRA